MTAWTKEPWEWQQEPLQTLENRKRAISCVNGCAGLNPAAYKEVVEELRHLVRILETGGTFTPDISYLEGLKHTLAASQEGA